MMQKNSEDQKKFMSSVKVGPKGQIVIPKEVRDMFGIQPGDTLMLLADAEKGIAIEQMSIFHKIADAILFGKELYPERSEEENRIFADTLREIIENEEQKSNH